MVSSSENISRRSFLRWVIVSAGGLITALLGFLGGGYFLSPLFQRKEEGWIDVGRADDFQAGIPTKVEYIERKHDAWVTTERRSSAWVLKTPGKEFTAFDPRCTHLGCPYRWNADQKAFMCPCHNAVFDVSGSVVSGPPPRPLDRYPTKVVSGRLMILPAVQEKSA